MIIDLTKKTKLKTGGKACPEDIEIHPVLEEKAIKESGVYVPGSGILGFSKVTVDVPDTVLENVASPVMPKLGRLKYFYNDRSEIGYKDTYASSVKGTLGVETQELRVRDELGDEIYHATIDTILQTLFCVSRNDEEYDRIPLTDCEACVIGGKKYYGFPCTSVSAIWAVFSKSKSGAGSHFIHLPSTYIPPCTCVILIGNASAGNISTVEYSVSSHVFEERTYQVVNSQRHGTGNAFNIYCNPDGGLILAAEFTYPKGNITFSGVAEGLEYSLDDGVTFSSVKDGLVLKGIEHVALRNSSDGADIYVGTTDGGSEIATIGVGTTRYIATPSSATWYVF